ncbi:MAG: polysaccharide pyruvyl transferase family protein [Pseudomonadota bacterium]
MPNFYPDDPVPVAWVRGQAEPNQPTYVNVGDALSPFLVTMVSGRPVAHGGFKRRKRRIGAIGTVGQVFENGVVDIWGTGCSPFFKPMKAELTRPYEIPEGTEVHVHAARGPQGAALLGAAGLVPYGDPAALLPEFYQPKIEKKWELGVVLHLSNLADRAFEAHPAPGQLRYHVPPEMADQVRLITMVGPDTVDGVQAKVDELLSCKRVVSNSLHGFVIPAAYGIPTLYMSDKAGNDGPAHSTLSEGRGPLLNARFVDLFGGYGIDEVAFWRQTKGEPTDWAALIEAVDRLAVDCKIDADALMQACPAGCAPLSAPRGGTIWDHPLIRQTPVAMRPAGAAQ